MRNSKKILLASVCFLLAVILFFTVLIYPTLTTRCSLNDSKQRQDLSGKLDYIFLGASQCRAAFVPQVANENLGVSSYNLSGPMMSIKGRYTILKKEIERNDIKTVVIDISFNGLHNTISGEKATGEPALLCKMDTAKERISYLTDTASLLNGDYENVLSMFCRYGLKEWKNIIKHRQSIDKTQLGYVKEPSRNLVIPEEKRFLVSNSTTLDMRFSTESVYWFKKIVKLCKDNNIRPIVVVLPVSESYIWEISNFTEFNKNLKGLCKETKCEMYDFNLIKNRMEIFSDEYSFVNTGHTSDTGAKAFTAEYCKVIKAIDGGADTKDIFYDTYEDVKENSIYNQ